MVWSTDPWRLLSPAARRDSGRSYLMTAASGRVLSSPENRDSWLPNWRAFPFEEEKPPQNKGFDRIADGAAHSVSIVRLPIIRLISL